jgi:aminopeptidase N
MKIRRIATAAALAATTFAIAAAPAAANSGPNLRVTEVSNPPAKVTAGDSFDVSGELRNRGKQGATAAVRIVLRRQGDEIEVGSDRVRVPARSTRDFDALATVPSSTPAGFYALLACVPKRGTEGREHCRFGGLVKVKSKQYAPGARTLGDPLFPQTGNGGYDALSYDLEIDYDPVANVFNSATTTMKATATQNLSSFSLDFQDMNVIAVSVNGAAASFEQVDSTPQLSADPEVTQPMKLVVTPATPIDSGTPMVVKVSYDGTPVRITDVDTSFEGWIPACYGPSQTAPCDGGFVVNQPNGAQGWFPSNNYPTDKATFETTITVPQTHTAFGIGELSSRVNNGDGTWTWSWSEDDPTSTYLTTATVGLFDYSLSSMIENSTNRALPIYNGIDASYGPPASTNLAASLAETPGLLNYLSDYYGAYPLDSIGTVVDRTTGVGYALEVQTKPHYAQISTANQDISTSTQLHEIAHMWWGNTVTLEQWTDIWFNEGWASWSEWIWGFETQGGDDPAAIFDDLYATVPDEEWEIAPAVLDGDPLNLFASFPTYDRGAMVVEATREIIGPDAFETLIDRLLTDFRYDNISTQEFIALAEEVSGFSGAQLALLDDFYEQWLYGEQKPTILPEDFGGPTPLSASSAERAGPVAIPRGGRR